MSKSLVKTLPLQLEIQEGKPSQLQNACLEARYVYNQTIKHAKKGTDWENIDTQIEAELVKNTKQRIIAKALEAMENYHEHEDYELPSHTKDDEYPLRMNYTEGYNLSVKDDEIRFRISTKPYNHIKGVVKGNPTHLEILEKALTTDNWSVGTAEALFKDDRPELHINVTNQKQEIREPKRSETVIGVDINEDNIALTALKENGECVGTLVVDYPEIKKERHRYFTMRKRMQNAGKTSFDRTFENKEKRVVHDYLHKLSRIVVVFASEFENPCISLEDLKDMRENIDYGTRMNRRLHSVPFRALQDAITYKANFEGIPVTSVNPKNTSQGCCLCGEVDNTVRNKHRFNCYSCDHQDHADRNASVNIAKRGMEDIELDVSSLKTLPHVRKLRRKASGCVNQPTLTFDSSVLDKSRECDGVKGVLS